MGACVVDAALGIAAEASTPMFIVFLVLLIGVSLVGTPIVIWRYRRRVDALMAPQHRAPAQPPGRAAEAAAAAAPPPAPGADAGAAPSAAVLTAAVAARLRALRRVLVAASALYTVPAALLMTLSPLQLSGARLPLAFEDRWLLVLGLADLVLIGSLCAPVVLIGLAHPAFGRHFVRRCAPLALLALGLRAALTDGSGEPVASGLTAMVFGLVFLAAFYRALGNRHARRVAPLLAVGCGLLIGGLLAATMLAEAGSRCLLGDTVGLGWQLLGLALIVNVFLSPLLLLWLAARTARALSRAYDAKAFSEAQLQEGCWWLVLLAVTAVGIGGMAPLAGPEMPLLAPLALGVFAFYLAGTRRLRAFAPPQPLLLLRVFAHDDRGERLLDETAFRWRYLGPLLMIGGPDTAPTTLDPHELLLFLRRRLRDHFVRDEAALARRLAALDERPDPDARYRVDELFCSESSWQPAVRALLQRCRVVLLDLRNFGPARRGTAYEITLLAREDALRRTVLLTNEGTDLAAVQAAVAEAGRAGVAPPSAVIDARAGLDGQALFEALAAAAGGPPAAA